MSDHDGLRRRKRLASTPAATVADNADDSVQYQLAIKPGTYWLTRIVLLRSIAFVYGVSFLVALHQNRALLGHNGLLPADQYLKQLAASAGNGLLARFTAAPTVFWLFDYSKHTDMLLNCAAYVGLSLSLFVIVCGGANIVIMTGLWFIYHSIVNVGQRWYSFGWESQLLESGFLAILLCPVLSVRPLTRSTPPPWVAIWGYRWLIFRIMIGAGLIKIRGDRCWRDMTCMNYHYETQPVPSPLSFFLHQTPAIVHQFETFGTHVVELGVPWLLLMTRRARLVGGIILVTFQAVLIVSGNLSFLNWLTILQCLACFDDTSLSILFSRSTCTQVSLLQQDQEQQKVSPRTRPQGDYVRSAANMSAALLIAYLSVPVVQNLLSTQQAMNTSFDPLRLVNTYGAFGSITKERTEVILQGTYDDIGLVGNEAVWHEYEFKCKPGRVDRQPCLISPYHYRLDWLMWFAAFQSYQHNPWLVHLVAKLLVNDADTLSLLAGNPFEGKPPPRYIRAEHYRYRFAKIGSGAASRGQWWTRKKIGAYFPPVDLRALEEVLKQMGWSVPQLEPVLAS